MALLLQEKPGIQVFSHFQFEPLGVLSDKQSPSWPGCPIPAQTWQAGLSEEMHSYLSRQRQGGQTPPWEVGHAPGVFIRACSSAFLTSASRSTWASTTTAEPVS